ncbi:hypothetical protein BCR34DRAFT_151804 [Clohesyomyces aquaticus]|uniref:Uncharacterized protein n=1 Tax=Clohesyomyces aquaticus TaxID=1231657 RepID=A0A1Y1YJN5_9PLEO|nr:hypothetical protein BCR34DRAFT_151804 [Clohesyomyces aquaticus]
MHLKNYPSATIGEKVEVGHTLATWEAVLEEAEQIEFERTTTLLLPSSGTITRPPYYLTLPDDSTAFGRVPPADAKVLYEKLNLWHPLSVYRLEICEPVEANQEADASEEHWRNFIDRWITIFREFLVMRGGYYYAMKFYLDLKVDVLHHPSMWFCIGRRTIINQRIDDEFRVMMSRLRDTPSDIDVGYGSPTVLPYIDACKACCRIRKRLSTFDCYFWIHHGQRCIHTYTQEVLDVLQKYAYVEVRVNVLRTVAQRLPREIADMILSLAIEAEKVPRDPRVFMDSPTGLDHKVFSQYDCRGILYDV